MTLSEVEVIPTGEVQGWIQLVLVFLAAISVPIIAGYFARKNSKKNSEEQAIMRREPSWVELSTDNTSLRSQLREIDEDNQALRSELKDFRNEFENFRDQVNARDLAYSNVLRDASIQWPTNTPGPVFDKNDLNVLADKVPAPWRKNFRPSPA